ncbi:Bcr/CflA family efflux MFS transporter [Nocardioides sp. zg-579]|uniref:Bcr/CflA family efflux MFS transporter n=1 Tax=Nocardioides marmotae TaxID=2663857 RepID=A0A6I3JEN4_9ACTN|nr:Bcr/CflA family efflux MFS transporter [Gordonia jinghuaiqii]MTB96493.1 Bcr/CflA family efflux MFS transporter [Nocardioides marmotae]
MVVLCRARPLRPLGGGRRWCSPENEPTLERRGACHTAPRAAPRTAGPDPAGRAADRHTAVVRRRATRENAAVTASPTDDQDTTPQRTAPAPAAAPAELSRAVLITLGALTAVAPLVTDLYLPGLPDLARSLGTSEAMAQLTMSVCLVGLALGQLVAGPWSDRVGRMRPLRWGVVVLTITSLLCAVATNVWVLLALRLVQGLAGAAAMVVARAIVRDVYDGARAAKVFSDLMLVMGLAPVLGPMLGGQLLAVTDWRGIFVFLGVVGALLVAASCLVLHETRPARTPSQAPVRRRALRRLVADTRFRGFLVMSALFGVVLFGYISMSSFVLQDDYGLGPVAYAWVFGANAAGMIVGSQVSARLVGQVGPAALLRAGVLLIAGASVALAVAFALDAPLAVVVVPMWLVLAGLGMSFGNSTALALTPHAADAGSAAALLGASQFLLGAAVPPLVSIGGVSGPLMGITMATAGVGALLALVLVILPRLGPDARGRARTPH